MYNIIKNESIGIKIFFFLISTFPIALLSPSSFINIYSVLIPTLLLYILIKEKNFKIFQDKIFIFIFLFWLCLIVVLFFSTNINNSISRTFGILRFVIFIPAIIFFFQYKKFKFAKTIFGIWFCVFILITFDLIFEHFIGHNILGYTSQMTGRLAGVMNEELKIGNYYLGFYLITISTIITYFNNLKKYKILIIFFIVLFTVVSFLIGERANFIRVIFALITFLIFSNIFTMKKMFFLIIISFIAVSIIFKFNKDLNNRYQYQMMTAISAGGIANFIYNSQYGAHYNTAYQMFKNHPFAGIGLKNFIFECKKDEYFNNRFSQSNRRCATHPHQIHLEIISHAGIFSYLFFLILFIYFTLRSLISFKKNKNLFQLSGAIFVLSYIFLPLPTGSFFTSYSAAIFWLNFSLALAFENYKMNIFKKT